jgi:autotransporter-associated beta strand protein
LYMTGAGIPGGNSIQIVALHQSVWNAGANGNWTESHWTNPQPPYPNYTTQAVVNTNYTVDVTSAQEADALVLSNGGKVAVGSTGSLAITQGATVSTGGVLSITSGSTLSATGVQLAGGTISGKGTLAPAVTLTAGGTLDAPLSGDTLNVSLTAGGTGNLTKTGQGTALIATDATYSGNTTISAGRLQLNGLNSALHAVTGAGELSLAASATATADSIAVGTLTIAAGSKITINPIAAGPLSESSKLSTVPEPSTFVILMLAGLGVMLYRKKMR